MSFIAPVLAVYAVSCVVHIPSLLQHLSPSPPLLRLIIFDPALVSCLVQILLLG